MNIFIFKQPVTRVLAYFVIGVTGEKDIRFFKTREETLTWLKENRRKVKE